MDHQDQINRAMRGKTVVEAPPVNVWGPHFIKQFALNGLAEQILMAAARAVDIDGLAHPIDIDPELANQAALDAIRAVMPRG
jgi:hypothetical protein